MAAIYSLFNFFKLLVPLFLFMSCKQYHENKVEVLLKSRLADCEEENIHFKIIQASDTSVVKLGDYVLPMCESEDCRDLIYTVSHIDTNSFFWAKGHLSKEGHGKIQYGCIGSHELKIHECKRYQLP